jgi:hypothetical protein
MCHLTLHEHRRGFRPEDTRPDLPNLVTVQGWPGVERPAGYALVGPHKRFTIDINPQQKEHHGQVPDFLSQRGDGRA